MVIEMTSYRCILAALLINSLILICSGLIWKRGAICQRIHSALRCHVESIDEVSGWSKETQSVFVSQHYQKKPLVVRNAARKFVANVDLGISDWEELAADDDVSTRLFVSTGAKSTKTYGPFDKKTLQRVYKKEKWSILLQELDRHVPQVADFWSSHFRFIPNWRRDDIMASVSCPGGTIGGHVDNYDVFLLQGSGRRRWSIENKIVTAAEEKRRAVKNSPTKLLRDFVADQSWVLEPGDMLYLPPRVAHEGVTIGTENDEVTFLVGLRAPSIVTLASTRWAETCEQRAPDRELFQSSDSLPTDFAAGSGSIAHSALGELRREINEMLLGASQSSEADSKIWLGRQLTAPLRPHLHDPSPFFLGDTDDRGDAVLAQLTTQELPDQAVWTCSGYTEKFDEEDDPLDAEFPPEPPAFISRAPAHVEGWSIPKDQLPYAIRSRHSVAIKNTFRTPQDVLQSVRGGICSLRRVEGLRVAYIDDTLFIDGQDYKLPRGEKDALAKRLGAAICDDNVIAPEELDRLFASTSTGSHATLERFLCRMIASGLYYPARKRTLYDN